MMTFESIKEEMSSMTIDDLTSVRDLADSLLRNKQIVEDNEERVDELTRQYSEAVGREVGDVWSQPTGAHDAYPTGAVVTHNSATWLNETPANVWEPGASGWREIPEENAVPAQYRQPTGAHDAYSLGDRISWNGMIYRSLQNGNVWAPNGNPDGWLWETHVPPGHVFPEPTPEPEPEPEDPAVPDPEPAPEVPEFVQPTGGHNAYALGDRVLFEGQVWESTIPANAYSPSAYPAGWSVVV